MREQRHTASPADAIGREVCWERGHHGPFLNLSRYAAVPGWEGFGDCTICGSTCWAGDRPRARSPLHPTPIDAPGPPA